MHICPKRPHAGVGWAKVLTHCLRCHTLSEVLDRERRRTGETDQQTGSHEGNPGRRHDAARAATSESLLEQPLPRVVSEGVGPAGVDAHHQDAAVAGVAA